MLSQLGLYDRNEDLDQLLMPLAAANTGSLTVIEGPAGIGKTRLLEESRRWARENGWLVLHTKGHELERHYSLGAARQLFEPLLYDLSPEARRSCMSGPAAITARLFQDAIEAAPSELGPLPDGSFAMLHGLTWLAINVGNTRQTLLQIDDLQWLDEASLRWLVYLLPRIDEVSVAVTVALRRDGTEAPDMVQRIACDPKAVVIRPQPLRPSSVARMLRTLLNQDAEAEFVQACCTETGGNPFLIREIATWLKNQRISPRSGNITQLKAIGGLAVSRRVAVRLSQLSEDAVTVAKALAVLDDGADLPQVTALAGLPYEASTRAIVSLMQSDLLIDRVPISFVHPVVRTAVYENTSIVERAALHAKAARILFTAAADNELVAAHLLLTPPGIDFAVRVLRQAAKDAVSRGAVASAFGYLVRCRQEALDRAELIDVLIEQGSIGQQVDLAASLSCLAQAHDMVEDPLQRAEIAWRLASSLVLAARINEGIQVLRNSLAELSDDTGDLKQRAYSFELIMAALLPNRPDLVRNLDYVRTLRQADGVGGRMLTSSIALHDGLAGLPSASPRARFALGRERLTGADTWRIAPAWHILIAADEPDSVEVIDTAIGWLHDCGDLTALSSAYTFRSLGWSYRGQLAEAEADGRQAQRAQEAAGVDIARGFLGAFLAESLLEQGKLDEAREALDWSGILDELSPTRPAYYVLCMRARLARLEGDYASGAEIALACGRVFAAHGGHNPAMVPWRTELALCLAALGEKEQARRYAQEDLELSRAFGAPRAIGRALRVSAGLVSGAERERLLRAAVAELEESSARLELAKALADLGTLLLATGERVEARETLRLALDLGSACGAQPLVESVRVELRAAGARPRRDELRGLESLTPSERRVAEMATDGATNRQIAEALFVTPKTVELHLTNVYRKLSIASRVDLADALAM